MSAVTARSTLQAVGGDSVRALQHALYRAAKADPTRRFHALFDKVCRSDVLDRAWEQVRRNRGAAGIDHTTLADVEEYGIDRLLGELAADLKQRRYRPLPARRVFIPKPGSSEQRPLSIPTVRDRIVQAAVRIVLEPIFEADMLDCSFGFRPRRSAHDALQVLIDESWRGRRWVVETDIANCFSAIPHEKLMQAVEERISDQGIMKLLRAMLRAGVMADGAVRREVSGTPQGGPISPLLCNVYLHRLDRAWDTREHGVLVRYCDDLVVMCQSRGQADAALARVTVLLGALGLEPKASKTRIVRLVDGSRRISHIVEVVGMESDVVTLQDLFVASSPTEEDAARAKRLLTPLQPTGLKPHFLEKLAANNVLLPPGFFAPDDQDLRAAFAVNGYGGQ